MQAHATGGEPSDMLPAAYVVLQLVYAYPAPHSLLHSGQRYEGGRSDSLQ